MYICGEKPNCMVPGSYQTLTVDCTETNPNPSTAVNPNKETATGDNGNNTLIPGSYTTLTVSYTGTNPNPRWVADPNMGANTRDSICTNNANDRSDSFSRLTHMLGTDAGTYIQGNQSQNISENTDITVTHAAEHAARSQFTVNLSKYQLKPSEYSLLDKGLTFLPAYRMFPVRDLYTLQNRLVRNLKLKDYFADNDNSDTDYDYNRILFELPSTWTPRNVTISNNTLSTIQELVKTTERLLSYRLTPDGQNFRLHNFLDNVSPDERQSLHELKNNHNIIIKPADKGSASIVMDRDCYITEAYRQLYNTVYYKLLDKPIYTENATRITVILQEMLHHNYITEKQFAFLQPKSTDRVRKFYLLPKVHKDRAKWPQPDKMPEGRPIVSNCGSESFRVAKYVDSFLKPISMQHPSYIKDTYDFISKIRGQVIPKDAFLVTGDVTGLYPNMRIDRIMETAREALANNPVQGRPDEYILLLLEITLRGNDFEFDGKTFLQICGTAMGIPYAPSLANIYMVKFDKEANTGFQSRPILYFRFIDDVFFVWCDTEENLRLFQSFLNSLIPGIEITLNWSKVEVNFLDTVVYKLPSENGDTIATKLYFKPTDTHQLLHCKSLHPKHTFRGVLKSQFIRFRRICTTKKDYDDATKVLIKALSVRNYSSRLMRRIKLEVWRDYSTEVTPKDSQNRSLLPIVVPFNELGTKLAYKWRKTITSNPVFANFRLISAYTIGKNLSKMLVRASLQATEPSNVGTFVPNLFGSNCKKCPNINCKACNYITEGKTFKSTHNNSQYMVRGDINCKSSNLIYLITCNQCELQYVGETGRTLGDRINDHLSRIRTLKPTPVGKHFNSPNHSLRDLRIMGIELFTINYSSDSRKVKENIWQTLLETTWPNGINELH